MTRSLEMNIETSLRDLIRPGTKRGLDFVIVDELRKRTGVELARF